GLHPSVDAVRAWADGLGWRAPAAFLTLVILRQLILLPAVVLLTAGGVIFAGLATAHPVGPLLAAHWTAGCSTIATSTFLLVIVPASYARAAALATFGSTLTEWGAAQALFAAALVAVVAIPLA